MIRRLDPVWTLIVVGSIIGAIFFQSQAEQSLVFVVKALIGVAPFLAIAVALAAAAKATGADNLIAKVFHGRELWMIMAAAFFGALSPFCSCGVIPVIAALLVAGVPIAPVMAFWLASPIMDPQMFFLTAGPLGFEFAIAKTISALFLGLFGGYVTYFISRMGGLTNPLRQDLALGCSGPSLADDEVVWRFWSEGDRRSVFWSEFISTTLFLGKWMTFAFILESLMVAYVPASLIASVLGNGNAFAIPLAVVIGVPAYMNGFAAIPLVAGLIDLGMTPAAGLAFMVAGGVSSIPAAIAVLALTRKPVFVVYLSLALIGSMIVGFSFQFYLA